MPQQNKLDHVPKQFTIDRAMWRFGGEAFVKNFGDTCLLNNEGYMCCLGFISAQCGIPEKFLLSQCNPNDVDYRLENPSSSKHPLNDFLVREKEIEDETGILDPLFVFENTWLAEEAIVINDNNLLTLQQREEELQKLFKRVDCELKFIGEYSPSQVELAEKIRAAAMPI